jgi:DNA-binding NtrC family response regulator
MDPDALTILQGYAWPGNVRELENTIERAVLMAEGETIRQRDLSLGAAPTLGPSTGGAPLPDTPPAETGTLTRLDEVERQTIVAALVRSNWIQKDAAKVLGISPRVLNYKIKSHRLTHPTWIRHKPPHSEAA